MRLTLGLPQLGLTRAIGGPSGIVLSAALGTLTVQSFRLETVIASSLRAHGVSMTDISLRLVRDHCGRLTWQSLCLEMEGWFTSTLWKYKWYDCLYTNSTMVE